MNNELKQVYINESDKLNFLSKSGIDNFKKFIKLNSEYDLMFLSSKYLKPNYVFEITENTNILIKFKINKIEKKESENINENVKKIKLKIKQIRSQRTNIVNKDNVPTEIFNEYTKLKKICTHLPIPPPHEVLKNPEQYKMMVSMALKNELVKQIPSNHPYIKYFKLLSKEIGIVNELQPQLQPQLQQHLPQLSPITNTRLELSDILEPEKQSENTISNDDDDTEDEDYNII